MSDAPNYKAYTLAELHDAQRHIDSAQYPERSRELDSEIQGRTKNPPPERSATLPATAIPSRSSESVFERMSRRVVGFYLIVSAVISLATLLYKPSIDAVPLVIAMYTGIVLIYVTMLTGGVLLYQRKRLGLWVALPAICLQIPSFQLWKVTYTLMSFPSFEIKLWPQIGFAFAASPTISCQWSTSVQPLYLAFNLWAVIAAGVLLHHLDKQQRARARLRRSMKPAAG